MTMDHSIAQPKMPYFEHQLPVEKRCVLHALNNVLQIGKDHAITCEDFVDIVKTFYPMGHMITKIASFNYNTLCSPASDGICAQDSWSFSIALEWLERNVERSDSHTPVYKELKVENNDPEILFTQKGHYYIFVQLKKDEEGKPYEEDTDWSNHAICVVDFKLFDSLENANKPPILLNRNKDYEHRNWSIDDFNENYNLMAVWKIHWPLNYKKKHQH